MDALQLSVKTKKLNLATLERPKITPREVLIEVAYAGICGTDLHIIQGEFPCNPDRPVTLGHEFSGTVVEVGSEVTTLKKGDRVSVDPNNGCLCCGFCHGGQPHFCPKEGLNNSVGIYRNGGWAQFCAVPDVQVHKLTDRISLEQAALLEPLSCLVHGWDIASPITIGKKILVTGAGIIGNLWVIALHLQGHRNVTVSEPNASRLELLEKIDTGYDLVTPDVLKERQKSNPDYLFDIVIDCSGFAPAIEYAISLLNYGGTLCMFGVAPPHSKISLAPFDVYWKELKIVGVKVNPFSFPKAIGLAEALGERYLDYGKLGIEVFPLKDYETAIDLLKKGSISKAVFKF